jgi:peptidyl-prolyl cis-trans isomerase A (cyclophilin A)
MWRSGWRLSVILALEAVCPGSPRANGLVKWCFTMNQVLLTATFSSAIFSGVIFSGSLLAQTPAKSTSAAKAPAAPAAAAGDLLHPATLNRTAPAVYRVKMATTKGDMVIEITRAWSPRGADRFYNLVRAGYYTDCPFYRVLPNFMAQFGISAKPEVTKAWADANIVDEPRKETNKRGRLSFATGGPNTRSTTLFINLVDNTYLDPLGFAPIGEVVEGMENADKLYNGYGETATQQHSFEVGGKAFVDRTYPKLDRILTATIVAAPAPAAAPAGGAAPAAPSGGAPAKGTKPQS